MDLRYLIHLAELGKGNLHPLGLKATLRLIEALKIEKGSRILEIGCGTGETMVRILSSHDVSIDGIDVLPQMLEKANLRIKVLGFRSKVRLFNQPVSDELPFTDNYYDRVYAESVLGFQNEEAVKNLLAESFRVLKKGGLFVMNEAIWKKTAAEEIIKEINTACIEDFGMRQASEKPWYIEEWKKIFNEIGFEISACDLIDDLLIDNHRKLMKSSYKVILSTALTKLFLAKGFLLAELRRVKSKYSDLLVKHSSDGKYIESRLFVLKKI